MDLVLQISLVTLLAGIAMPAGALLARIENLRPQWLENEVRHSVVAFGGGALLSAVALVLVPDATRQLAPLPAAACFILGGLAFMWLDRLLYKLKTAASQLAAMLADFIPESLALGAAFAASGTSGYLLALLMALQNLPEGFNAFRELRESSHRYPAGRIIKLFVLMAMLGPLAALAGYFWLAAYPQWVAGIMLFASGGILYSVFQDIAPQAVLEEHWAPPMGAVLGFMLGMVGHMLTQHSPG